MSEKPSQRVARGMKRHGSRYKARRRAVDLLFEGETRDTDPVVLAQERNELATNPDNQVAPVNTYTVTIVDGVAVNLDFLDETIERYLTDDWELYRIPAVDRAILRLSVWELVFNPEVPVKTAVVEGTELASQYSGDKAASYINALLDRVSRDVASLRLQATPLVAADEEISEKDSELLDRLVVGDEQPAADDNAPEQGTTTPTDGDTLVDAPLAEGDVDSSLTPTASDQNGAAPPAGTEDSGDGDLTAQEAPSDDTEPTQPPQV